jgi:phosphatidyl-myo-inositol alpha-mannosyltransferase
MTTPLRIALVAPYDLARDGGIGTHIRAQARALRVRGHAVTVLGPASAPLAGGEIALGGSQRVTLGGTESGLGLNPLTARRIATLFDATRFDIVHVHEPLTPLVPWLVLRRAKAPIVGTFHVHREQGHRLYAAGRPVLERLMRRVAFRIAVSDAARRTVASHFPGAYEIVPNGIDLDRFRAPCPRPTVFAGNRQHILYVGRLEPRKGVAHLIRAMRHVQDRAPSARLMIAGEGPDRASLETLARDIGVDATFTGRIPDAELPAYYQASDVVSAPAVGGESFGLVLLEAMACGKPVVASRIDGYDGLVGDSDSARLVAPADADALAGALATLLNDEAQRRALGIRGAAHAVRFDWGAIVVRLESIYSGLLERPSCDGERMWRGASALR